MTITVGQVREASYVLEQIKKLRDLKKELQERDADFVDGDRRRAIGRMQLDDTQIEEIRSAMHVAAMKWFEDHIEALHSDLEEMGIDVDGERAA